MSLLSVNNLTFTYSLDESGMCKDTLKNISFSIERGEYVVLAGSNGSGKSTLARLLCGFLQADGGELSIAESVACENKIVPTGIVFQSPRDQLVANTVGRDTAFGPENLRLQQEEIHSRVTEALSLTALLERVTQKTITLSLGQKQKLAFAGITALHPSLLVLDETLSMVDRKSRSEILKFIESYHLAGNTIIHITHIEEEIRKAQRVLFLQEGKIAFDGTPIEYFSNIAPAHNLDTYCKKKVFAESEFSLELRDITYSPLSSEKSASKLKATLFTDLNLSFKKGTLTALTGKSGSGKTTIMEIACGLCSLSKGEVLCTDRPVLALQESESALFEEFAADDVAYALRVRGITGSELNKCTQKAMERASLPFREFADRRTFTLSGGEKRKLSIAGVLALDSSVYFFDEPTAGLDPVSTVHILGLLRDLANEGKTVIFSTHSQKEEQLADRIICLDNGCVVKDTDSKNEYCENSKQSVSNKVKANLPIQDCYSEAKRIQKLQSTALGMYAAKKTIVHDLTPVIKYVCMVILLVAGFVSSTTPFLSGVILLAFVYAVLAQYPLQNLLINMGRIIPWIVFFFLLQICFFETSESDTVYFSFGFISITEGKMLSVLKTMLHYLAALITLSVFLYSTDESEILEGLRDILYPFTLIKIPVHHVVLVVGMIFRFIPLLAEEAMLILKAQTIRNGGKQMKGFFKNIRSMGPIFIPLMLQTLRRAEAFADALQARYYEKE